MEFMPGGTLRQVICFEDFFFVCFLTLFCCHGQVSMLCKKAPLTEKNIAYVARETLKGVKYLHQNQIVHRDLKDLNIMLGVNATVCLCSYFGLVLSWLIKSFKTD